MDFEEQIQLLSKEIYEKAVKYIDEKKSYDDIMYEYAYLKLDNGKQVMYNFDTGYLYITDKKAKGYTIFCYDAKLKNEDTIYNINRARYETLVKEKILNSRSDSQIESYEIDLKRQQKMSLEKKNIILMYYKELNSLIDTLKYNKKKTHNIDNYNNDTLDVYNEYMYKKELDKLAEANEDVLPSVKIAVNWWAKTICGDTRGGSIGEDLDSELLMAFSNKIYPKDGILPEQVNKFKEVLAKKIMDKIYESDEVIQMKCDYGADWLLYDAMKESGINPRRTPFKTNMYIRAYFAVVKEGYGAKDISLYDSTTKEDLENVKNICCNNVQDKVLSKKL